MTSPGGIVILGKVLILLWDISVIVILEFEILSSISCILDMASAVKINCFNNLSWCAGCSFPY